jgi:DNA processing protein
MLIEGLVGRNVVIVSGLALGIDTLAHETALDVGLTTISFPGSGLDESVIYPRQNLNLARRIVESGGALVSEYEPTMRATMWSFPQRNRLMAGISKATLIVEASEKSGTLITARLALDYNRDLLTIPGSILFEGNRGSLSLLRQGAAAITSVDDLLQELGFDLKAKKISDREASAEEKIVLNYLSQPIPKDELLRSLMQVMNVGTANALMLEMEIKGMISESMGEMHING